MTPKKTPFYQWISVMARAGESRYLHVGVDAPTHAKAVEAALALQPEWTPVLTLRTCHVSPRLFLTAENGALGLPNGVYLIRRDRTDSPGVLARDALAMFRLQHPGNFELQVWDELGREVIADDSPADLSTSLHLHHLDTTADGRGRFLLDPSGYLAFEQSVSVQVEFRAQLTTTITTSEKDPQAIAALVDKQLDLDVELKAGNAQECGYAIQRFSMEPIDNDGNLVFERHDPQEATLYQVGELVEDRHGDADQRLQEAVRLLAQIRRDILFRDSERKSWDLTDIERALYICDPFHQYHPQEG